MIVLKPKERLIAQLLLQGCTNAEIAQELGTKLRTVKSHLHRMFLKCRVGNEGIKRVNLAVRLFKDSSWETGTDRACLASESTRSSASSPAA